MNEKIEKMINDQMNFELYSSYIYMAMAAYCDSIDLEGFAHWFKMQVQEEMYHAIKMYNYLFERGARPFFTQIDAPAKEWKSVKAAFENALEHEKLVTERINNLMTAAIKENDHASRSFLNWFVDEQVEEEASVDSIIKKLNLIKDSGEGLFMIEKELAARVFTTPPDMKLQLKQKKQPKEFKMSEHLKAIQISDNIYGVGAIDWGVRNFHGYTTDRGTTCNAYLVIDDKITLFNTVKNGFKDPTEDIKKDCFALGQTVA